MNESKLAMASPQDREAALVALGLLKPVENHAAVERAASAHRFQRFPFGGFRIQQRGDALVQRD